MKYLRILLLIPFITIFFGGCGTEKNDELVIYSARIEELIKPVFDEYTKETGVNIKFITDKEGPLLQKIKNEGENTQADILITVDAGNLWQAANEGILQSIESEILIKNIPEHLRDPQNQWFGFSVRARTIFYNKNKVNPEDLSSYEDLASQNWKNKLGLRTSKKVYNQSLVAMLIAEHGLEKTEEIVKGWVNNLAADVYSDDTNLLNAISAGQCDVGIANTYYYGRLIKNDPLFPVGIFWANQNENGVHVNISGAGVTKHSKNKEQAIKFLEWLSSEKAQRIFSEVNLEFPANPAVESVDLVKKWGSFKQNPINVSKAGELQIESIKLMDRAGYK